MEQRVLIELAGLVIMIIGFLMFFKALFEKDREVLDPLDVELKNLSLMVKNKEKVEVSIKKIARLSWLREEYKRNENTILPSIALNEENEVNFTEEIEEEIQRWVKSLYSYQNKTVISFYESKIKPILPRLIKNRTFEAVMKILIFLSAKGNVPSVVDNQKKDSSCSYTLLKKVSLIEHSINTANEGLKLLKEEFPYFYDILPDKYLILFLGHDLGKAIPGESYTTQDHPILSAHILSDFIPSSVSWKKDVLEAVKNHHIQLQKENMRAVDPDKWDLWILQTVDRKAREYEIQMLAESDELERNDIKDKNGNENSENPVPSSSLIGDDTRTRPVNIMPVDIFKKILPIVNRIITREDLNNQKLPVPEDTPEGNFLAVSQPDGNVYVRPDVIYKAFILTIQERKLQKENAALLAKPKNEALRDLVFWLMENNCIPPGHVKPGYYGRWYKITFNGGKSYEVLFTPLLIHVFDILPGELEKKRKENSKLVGITFKKINKPKK